MTRETVLKVLAVVALILGAAGLSMLGSPASSRAQKINALVASGTLGKVPAGLQQRLDAQFRWLATNAGVSIDVAVNEPLHKNRLTLLVTEPAYQDLTRCGPGNAIYDPGLSAILIDKGLVYPYEANIVGTTSVSTMFSPEDLPHVVHYTNFIIAHEIGHWLNRNQASAFFYYGLNEGTGNLSDELDADRSAIQTLRAGYANGGEPPGAPKPRDSNNNPSDHPRSDDERLAEEVLWGIILMNEDLLFSNSPYSPYFSDQAHPNFLTRVGDAIRQVGGADPHVSRTEYLAAYAQRFAALGDWVHRELFFPGPIAAADFRDGALWIGQLDIPPPPTGPGQFQPVEEKLYRIPAETLRASEGSSAYSFRRLRPIQTGYSRVGEEFNYEENVGAWVSKQIDHGSLEAGLSPPPLAKDLYSEIIWGASRWGGLQKGGVRWKWSDRGSQPAGEVTEEQLRTAIRSAFPKGDITLGRLQWTDDGIGVPFRLEADGFQAFRALRIASAVPLSLDAAKATFLHVSDAQVDIEGATFWHGAWWVPIRKDVSRAGYRTQIWKLTPTLSRLFGEAAFLPGEKGSTHYESYLAAITPESAHFRPISADRAIFGYDGDALYLLDDHQAQMRLLFAPMRAGVGVVDLGEGRLLVWTRNSRKAYLIETQAAVAPRREPWWSGFLRWLGV